MSDGVDITNLERNVRRYKAALEKRGYTVTTTSFRCGVKGAIHYGPSYVEVEITNRSGFYLNIKFLTHSCWGDRYKGEIHGTSWGQMKATVEKIIARQEGLIARQNQQTHCTAIAQQAEHGV